MGVSLTFCNTTAYVMLYDYNDCYYNLLKSLSVCYR